MPPKTDITKASWESNDIPAVCEDCLGPNPFVKMLRQQFGEQCKVCTRPFTVFRWYPEKEGKPKKTMICLTCARQKNCCQCCMRDLTYGLPLSIRDAALKMTDVGGQAPESSSDITKQFIAQNYELSLKNGATNSNDHNLKAQSAARQLLKKLANAKPYTQLSKEERDELYGNNQNQNKNNIDNSYRKKEVLKYVSKLPLKSRINPPPKDETITSLFIMGIEDDLPEYVIREYFQQFGSIKSLICLHRAKAGYVTFKSRQVAEKAAQSIPPPQDQPNSPGKLILNKCILRVTWGHPKPLGNTYSEQAEVGRFIKKAIRPKKNYQNISQKTTE